MFTGLIEEIGTITSIEKLDNGAYITVSCKKVLSGTKIDDSIAINGVCETVIKISDREFKVFASYETLKSSNISNLKINSKVNLERALLVTDRLGGHIVQGHVDDVAIFQKSQKYGDAYKLDFKVSDAILKQIVKKGSVAINGVSLTVAEINDNIISIAVIPHTFESTNLSLLKPKEKVNIETDIISKYVEKYLLPNDNNRKIDENFLERNGFI